MDVIQITIDFGRNEVGTRALIHPPAVRNPRHEAARHIRRGRKSRAGVTFQNPGFILKM